MNCDVAVKNGISGGIGRSQDLTDALIDKSRVGQLLLVRFLAQTSFDDLSFKHTQPWRSVSQIREGFTERTPRQTVLGCELLTPGRIYFRNFATVDNRVEEPVHAIIVKAFSQSEVKLIVSAVPRSACAPFGNSVPPTLKFEQRIPGRLRVPGMAA